jgi:2-dehydro-3-deoxyphosphogluconate aldolase/(4S)-4-hydroxy-2-oxoglutarate aldolase
MMGALQPEPAVIDRIAHQFVLPVLREPTIDEAAAALDQLAEAGCRVVEVTTSTPLWERVVVAYADVMTLGLGTVTSVPQAETAVEAGARFVVTPFPVPAVQAWCRVHDVVVIPGGGTPAELASVAQDGIVKVFPAHVGGPRYLRSLRPILPDVRLVPTGGIGWDDVDAYAAAGAFAVGIGSGLKLPPKQLADMFERVRRP